MSISIREALSIGCLKDCKLIAGENGIDNQIHVIDTMEIPDIIPWLKRNELLITTGYSLSKGTSTLRDLIRALHEAQSAGLAIKTRFLGEISQEVIQTADELAVPLIVIPAETPFVDITIPLMKSILDRQHVRLEFSAEIHRQFEKLELSGGGMSSLAEKLGQLLSMSLVITDTNCSVLAISADKDQIPSITAALAGHRAQFVSQDAENILHLDGAYLISRPVHVKGGIRGYVFLFHESPSLDEMQTIILDHAVTAVALEFSKLDVLNEHIRQMDSNLFLDIILKNIRDEEAVSYRAQYLHWPPLPLSLAVLDIDDFSQFAADRSEFETLETKYAISSMISGLLPSGTVISKSDSFSCILPSSVRADDLTQSLFQLQAMVQKRFGLRFTAGIVSNIHSYLELGSAYPEAKDAICISRLDPDSASILCIEDRRLDQALLHSQDDLYLRQFCCDTVGRLVQYDREHHTELFLTLKELIRNFGIRTQTAEALFLHRNSLLHRIRRIEQLLGCSLSCGETLAELAIAVKAYTYMHQDEPDK